MPIRMIRLLLLLSFFAVTGIDFARSETIFGITFDGNLYSISTTDASSTLIGSGTYTGIVGGLEYESSSGNLLAITSAFDNPTSLYRVDPLSGTSTEIGPTLIQTVFEGALQFGPGGDLYATNAYSEAGSSTELLLRINPDTGAVVSSSEFSADVDINGLAWSDGRLIGIDSRGNDLVAIDPDSATVTVLGGLPRPAGSIGGMTNGPDGLGYFTASGELFSIDFQSGQTNSIGATGLFLAGLASAPVAIPEPSSVALHAVLLTGLVLRRRRVRTRS